MQVGKFYFLGIIVLLLSGCGKPPVPPMAEIKPHVLEIHGHQRTDNYYWLRERDNPAVLDYLEAENAYRDKVMAPAKKFENTIFEEMKSRIKEDDSSVPYHLDDYWYYTRYEEGKEYPIYCRQAGSLDAPEEILLDVNALAAGHEFCKVAGFKLSPDHRIISYAVDFVGRRKYTLRFLEAATSNYMPDEVPDLTANFAWANDNKTVFYAKQHPETLRFDTIFKHTLGGAQDEPVYYEADDTYSVYMDKSLSKKYLIIACSSTLQTEMRILDADTPDGEFAVFQPREAGHEYGIEHGGDCWYVLTNDNAQNFRLMQTPESATDKSNWREVVAHDTKILIEDMTIFQDYIVLKEAIDGLSQILVIDRRTNASHYIDFGEPVYTAYVSTNAEYASQILRYGFQSMKTPDSIFDYDMFTRARELKKQQPVLGGFNADNYETERLWAKAEDSTLVPISVLYKKATQKNGGNPLFIYGYGSYGFSETPDFSSKRLSLVDRGFVYAIAHVRGGSEMGRVWYENGRQLHKKNTFTDFIACTRFLIDAGYTSPQHVYADGGSAGGLLMGAVANMAPELYNGIIAEVPFVDVVTTMLDDSIPLTTAEYDEWGNPNIKEYYDYILSYSPYDNVTAQNYPNLFVTAGLHDSQVQYWEPAKWVAKLRAIKTDDNLLLLSTNMEAGHSGASGRFQALREDAKIYTFVLMLEGMVN